VVVDHGRIVHDGTLDDLHSRYGSQRRVVVDLDEPTDRVDVPGALLEATESGGRRLTYALTGPPGPLLAALAGTGKLRDVAILEPEIEDVVAKLYSANRASGRS
jgi:ABC-2 type transport system ATP-binding protein